MWYGLDSLKYIRKKEWLKTNDINIQIKKLKKISKLNSRTVKNNKIREESNETNQTLASENLITCFVLLHSISISRVIS